MPGALTIANCHKLGSLQALERIVRLGKGDYYGSGYCLNLYGLSELESLFGLQGLAGSLPER